MIKNKGYRVTEEVKKKISLALKGKIPKNIKMIAGWNKGLKVSEKMKQRISNTLKKKGIKPILPFVSYGKDNPNWKGNNVSYSGLHYWLRRKLGEPKVCEHCKSSKRRLTWANKSWKYKRDIKDWISLCYSCHKYYDLKRL